MRSQVRGGDNDKLYFSALFDSEPERWRNRKEVQRGAEQKMPPRQYTYFNPLGPKLFTLCILHKVHPTLIDSCSPGFGTSFDECIVSHYMFLL